jgi:hypothetical protein
MRSFSVSFWFVVVVATERRVRLRRTTNKELTELCVLASKRRSRREGWGVTNVCPALDRKGENVALLFLEPTLHVVARIASRSAQRESVSGRPAEYLRAWLAHMVRQTVVELGRIAGRIVHD